MPFLHTRKEKAAALVAALGLLIVVALVPFATGILGIVVLYAIFGPIHRRLVRHLPPRLSAFLVTLLAFVVVLLPGIILVTTAVNEAPGTVESIRESRLLREWSTREVGGVPVGARLAEAGGTAVSWVAGQAFTFFGSALSACLAMVIAFFGLYYLLNASGTVWEGIRGYLPFSGATAEALRARFHKVTEATLIGTALTALVQGSLVGLGFWVTGLPNAVFWGMITAVVSVLPVMGSALVWMPGVVFLLLNTQWVGAVVLLLLGGFGSSADNLVRMVVYKQVSDIHPMVTLVGAFAGLKYLGLLGVLLGPLAIAYFFELVKTYQVEYGDAAADAPAPAPAATEVEPAQSV